MLGLIIIANLLHLIEIVCIQTLLLFKSYYNVNYTNNLNNSHIHYYNSSNFNT